MGGAADNLPHLKHTVQPLLRDWISTQPDLRYIFKQFNRMVIHGVAMSSRHPVASRAHSPLKVAL